MNKRLWVTAAGALALTMSMSARADFIDLFTDPPGGQLVDTKLSAFYPDKSQAGDYPSTILGGFRDLIVKDLEGNATNLTGSTLAVEGERLHFANDPGRKAEGTVQWDGDDSAGDIAILNKIGLQTTQIVTNPDTGEDEEVTRGVDLVNQEGCPVGGCDRFRFGIYSSDAGEDVAWYFTIGLYTDDTQWTEFDLLATFVPYTDIPTFSELLFSDFTSSDKCGDTGGFTNPAVITKRCGSGDTLPVDVTNLGAMQLIFNVTTAAGDPTFALDLQIGSIRKTGEVPEPHIVALLGVGLVGAGFVSRRRSRQTKA